MSWLRIDGSLYDNQKVVNLSHVAFRLYIGSIAECSRKRTDGRIGTDLLTSLTRSFGAFSIHQQELIEAGLWERRQDGIEIHDYLAYNPDRVTIELRRADRARAGRKGAAVTNAKWLGAGASVEAANQATVATADGAADEQAGTSAGVRPVPVPEPDSLNRSEPKPEGTAADAALLKEEEPGAGDEEGFWPVEFGDE